MRLKWGVGVTRSGSPALKLSRLTESHARPMTPCLLRCVFVTGLLTSGLATSLAQESPSAAPTVDFAREVRPILVDHCFRCHGVDESDRQSGLRLDEREAALAGGESGEPAIVPGTSQKSAMMARILSEDPDLVMPPPSEKKPLTENQKHILARWIEEGASYSGHWSFITPIKRWPDAHPKDSTEAGADRISAHPIDAWVRAKLAQRGGSLARRAEPATLARRLYLDLIGLPPSPAEIEAFSREGVDRTVEQLLASERFGERWARVWLDVARYSDTNGYEKDLRRDVWIWRDWVIRAWNRDMPYDQFLIEQLAGDQLPGATQEQIIATGFLRNSMLNEEGAIVPEQFRMFEMFDRMDCLGKAVLGLTLQCAQCHSHKFDPLTQDEYYGIFAFLNNTYESQSYVYDEGQLREKAEVIQGVAAVEEDLRQQRPGWKSEMDAWVADILRQQIEWIPLRATELESVSGLNHPVQYADGTVTMLGHVSSDIYLIATPEMSSVTGVRLEALTHGDLPFLGPGRNRTDGSWNVSELEVSIQRPGQGDWEKVPLSMATADFSNDEVASADGKGATGPVKFLIDGNDQTLWRSDRGPGRRNQPSVAVVQFERALELPPGTQMKVALRMNEMLGSCRISVTGHSGPTATGVDYGAVLAMQIAADKRTDADEKLIFSAWRRQVPDCKVWSDKIESLWQRYPAASTTMLHLAERNEAHRRITHRLDRGEWDRPHQAIAPHTPASLHAWEPTGESDRLAFARWLASPRSPLTARVEVNRIWQTLFGEGLVETAEDFGTRAPLPEHVELLDWLAVDFMEHGWSRKHLLKQIVTSETYQQSSRMEPEQLEQDPRNRWLARGPRFRPDAEVVRDMALSISGLLTHRVGGEPILPPVPQNVLDYNYVYPGYWTPTQGPERYRRTVYGFRKRSMPDPVMSALDGPNGDTACARRVRSNTPLAALTTLNETIFVEAAQAMALRVLREADATDGARADYAFSLCTGRKPTDAERAEILRLLQSRRLKIAEGWLNPRAIATGDATKLPDLPAGSTPQDAAAWTLVARVLLNLDETLSKN